MAVHRVPRVGDIYWLRDCPPLRGETAKTRPVVLVTSVQAGAALNGILVVACTTSCYPSDTWAIELPSQPEGKVRSGLRQKTWAVPQWTVLVRREQLGTYQGYISGPLLDELIRAFMTHYQANRGKLDAGGAS